jgi:Zn-dependent protease
VTSGLRKNRKAPDPRYSVDERKPPVFLLEPNETPWDLKWRMLGTSIRVHPMFWLFSALLGSGLEKLGIQYLLLWVACVFVSILVHEFGHVLTARFFGMRDGYIVLYSFGGLAVHHEHLRSHWQRIAVCAAGPLAGFLILVLLWLALGSPPIFLQREWLPDTYLLLFHINLFWGVLNLLPVWPLDGGQISRDLCRWLSPEKGLRVSLGLSLVVAGFLAINAIIAQTRGGLLPEVHLEGWFGWVLGMTVAIFNQGSWWNAFLFGMMAVESFLQLQALDHYEHRPWED